MMLDWVHWNDIWELMWPGVIVPSVLQKWTLPTCDVGRKGFNWSLLNVITTLITLHGSSKDECPGYKELWWLLEWGFRETPRGRLRDLHGWMDRWMAKPGHGPHGTMMAWWGCPQWKPRTRAGLQTWSSGAGGQRGASDVAYKVASRRSRVARCPGPGRVRELEWKTVSDHALQRLGKRAALNTIGLGNVRGLRSCREARNPSIPIRLMLFRSTTLQFIIRNFNSTNSKFLASTLDYLWTVILFSWPCSAFLIYHHVFISFFLAIFVIFRIFYLIASIFKWILFYSTPCFWSGT